ncbi:Diacylglycerol kinase [Austwickia sp. TVS 96-490-7B]|uniref:diacylglycerol/lipid kinase family protein n=1 Tax=Austwickia sp. TVS 96-490-7B TaxID=2830843 RepID=UPI001D610EBD|nr:diacylglycerol kinase family protein [Austwickia sp. TVS 96-490-7B]MBW3084041.1 Diacylglycerol kinase [Austwickia sp. TVS 96-490-7B]
MTRDHAGDGPRQRAAVVVNPTKFDDMAPVVEVLRRVSEEQGWDDPLILETTPEETGTPQARLAVEQGVDVVCALGGDGTVRAVATALVGTQMPLGLLPGGTGNLLARNLDLPLEDLEWSLRIALTGHDRKVDVGVLHIDSQSGDPAPTGDGLPTGDGSPEGDRSPESGSAAAADEPSGSEGQEHLFLVMAGVGFDADVMVQAPEDLKARVGWAAYLVSGARNLYGPRFGATLSFDDDAPQHRQIRTAIIGNCGRLQGGVELLPGASVDDGALDALLLSPQGIVGWAGVAARVLTKQRKGHSRVEHRRCTTVRVVLDHPQEVQLDGDPVGQGSVLTSTVRRGALTVRVPLASSLNGDTTRVVEDVSTVPTTTNPQISSSSQSASATG